MATPRAVELTDLPLAEPNMQDVEVIALRGRLFLLYAAWPRPDRPDEPSGVAVLEFRRWVQFQGGGPNDEALHNHPMARHGLQVCTNHEVLDSPAVRTVLDVAHRDGPDRDPAYLSGLRHFVFAFKEGTFDCFAEGYHFMGLYDSTKLALAAITEALPLPPPWAPPPPPRTPLEERDDHVSCREESCEAGAVRFSVFCAEHHMARLGDASRAGAVPE